MVVRRSVGVVFGSAVLLNMFAGCGGEETPKTKPKSETPTQAAQKENSSLPPQLTGATPQTGSSVASENPALNVASTDIGDLLKPNATNPLIGSWLGVATLDTGLLKQKLERVDDVERTRLQKVADTFLTYQVAMDFYSDGRLGMVVQFSLEGSEQLISATGTWKEVQRDAESMIVELVEQVEGQTANTSQVRIMIHPDGQQIARPAELDAQLAVCEPMFIFNRIPEDFAQQIANQPAGTTIK
ncbi:MAG: hypothetical protein JNL67_06860 [Planctomycetaceae bacterium]|nr:hypothetical protein [Planctomycetaceae bacterium]